MKPGLAILPMEVWADAFEHPLITRELLAQIADNNGDPGFTAKLQKFLHDPRCGKHSLRPLRIKSFLKRPDGYCASLTVAPRTTMQKHREFPESEMPENINGFKQLTIEHFDDQVLDFLTKIRTLFTNVYLRIELCKSNEGNMRLLLEHLLPMVANIRGIRCDVNRFEFVQRHFPDKLALAKELDLLNSAEPAFIRAYMNWLCAPQDFGVDAPKFLIMRALTSNINTIIDTIRKHFLDAASPSTFVIFIQYYPRDLPFHANEFQIENAATKEELVVRNAIFQRQIYNITMTVHYVEIMRHPIGANANMRRWVEQRAFFEEEYNYRKNRSLYYGDPDAEQLISIYVPKLTWRIGKNKKVHAMDQDKGQPADDAEDDGPSTSAAKKMEI